MRKPKYGADKPYLIALSLAGTIFWFGFGILIYSDTSLPRSGREIALVEGVAVGTAALFVTSVFIASSFFLKFRQRDRLLELIDWRGVGDILDVGCGPGLLLIGAAKRAPEATAVGVDIWQKRAETGNRAERALENAEIEGVAPRVKVGEGDVRNLRFSDSAFDVVVSRAVLHNMKGPDERKRAIGEIARVLKPDGQAGLILVDAWHEREYLGLLEQFGIHVQKIIRPPRYFPPGMGLLTTVVGKKSDSVLK